MYLVHLLLWALKAVKEKKWQSKKRNTVKAAEGRERKGLGLHVQACFFYHWYKLQLSQAVSNQSGQINYKTTQIFK